MTIISEVKGRDRGQAIHFLEALGAVVHSDGVSIGKEQAILLAHRFLELTDKVTKLKGMIDTNNPASPTRAELDAL